MAIIFLRTLILFSILLLLMRLLGKRQMGELELSELMVSVLIADLAATPLQDIGIPLINGIVPILILFSCELVISGITMKSVRLRALIFGRPCMLIKDGRILQEQMRRCRFTIDELTEELRSREIDDISKVKYAVLETNGTLSTMLFPAETPATAGQLGIQCADRGYPYIVIDEGRVLSANLKLLGRDEKWLRNELKKRGVPSADGVYLMIVYESGKIFFAEKDRNE